MFFCVVAALIACSESGRIDTEYLGTWRLQNRKNIHTILFLKNNGTFEVDLRVEGQMSKIVEKKGHASGTWRSNRVDGIFALDVTEGDPEIGWQTGGRNFAVREMDGQVMVLASPDGKTHRWEKVRSRKSEDPSELASIPLAPVVVNLSPSSIKANRRYTWLCAALDIILRPENGPPEISPQLKYEIILFLSSKRYEDVNTRDKLKAASRELRDLVDPYMAGRVEEVIFEKTIVTGNREAVDTFCAEYEKS